MWEKYQYLKLLESIDAIITNYEPSAKVRGVTLSDPIEGNFGVSIPSEETEGPVDTVIVENPGVGNPTANIEETKETAEMPDEATEEVRSDLDELKKIPGLPKSGKKAPVKSSKTPRGSRSAKGTGQ